MYIMVDIIGVKIDTRIHKSKLLIGEQCLV